MESDILVLYYSRTGNTAALADAIAIGIESVPGAAARIRTVPPISATCEATETPIPESGPPYATHQDLIECAGIALGSPTRFGNMAAPMKYFWDQTGPLWQSGDLIGKPAGCFTSTGSLHGGQETTLVSMMIPLLHHGMMILGCPYSIPNLMSTQSGGTPYGPTHCAGPSASNPLTQDEKEIGSFFGQNLAKAALALEKTR